MFMSRTKNEPVHYMLKIESFSILSEDRSIKIESDVFEAAGHKWRLDLHLNGNEEEEGNNYISLYLMICDTASLSKGWKVRVDVNFLVYDHMRHNYVSFQDGDGNRTMFHERALHEKQSKWGFPKLISLEDFSNSSSGYIFNDSCVFGAEVFVVPEFNLKDRCLSMLKPPTTMNTYTWTVHKFSAIKVPKNDGLSSEVFKVDKLKWTLSLYPTVNCFGVFWDMSVYLKVHEEDASLPDGWRVYAKYEVRVKNQSGYADEVKECDHWFCKFDDSSYVKLLSGPDDKSKASKGFVVNDRLIVEAKISVIGMLRNFI